MGPGMTYPGGGERSLKAPTRPTLRGQVLSNRWRERRRNSRRRGLGTAEDEEPVFILLYNQPEGGDCRPRLSPRVEARVVRKVNSPLNSLLPPTPRQLPEVCLHLNGSFLEAHFDGPSSLRSSGSLAVLARRGLFLIWSMIQRWPFTAPGSLSDEKDGSPVGRELAI